MIDRQFILYHYRCWYSNKCAFRGRTIVRGRQRESGAKIRSGFLSRSMDPRFATTWTHLGAFTKCWCPPPGHCNRIHLVCGEAVAWHWGSWHFPGDRTVQQSRGTLNWVARILPSQGCSEPGLLSETSVHLPTLQKEGSPLCMWHLIGLWWLCQRCLSLKQHSLVL